MSSQNDGRAPLPAVALILAAGQGKRMRSALTKILHPVAGQPMLGWVLAAARQAGCQRLLVVVAPHADDVRERFAADDVTWVVQEEPRGTGHAVAAAEPYLPEAARLLILSGDVPLVTPATLGRLLEEATGAWGSMAVADLEAPGSLGRVLSDDGRRLRRIVEAADASPEERAVRCVNAGLYALPSPQLFDHLRQLRPNNAQGELYLTDALTAAVAAGEEVRMVTLDDPAEAWGINNRQELARVHLRMLARSAEQLMLEGGVTVLDPARTVIEPGVVVGRDTVIHPGVSLLGDTRVGEGCVLHQGAWLRDTHLGDGVVVAPYSVLEGARAAAGCRVGPFARLRPGAVLEDEVKVGNFVEVKNSRLERGVKAGHLAYLGDATVGAEANIGAGVITCNYDGERKHRTEIGAGTFVGSDTMLVAPVTVGEGATTGAGSVITHEVPAGALAVGRARQRNIEDWAQRRRRRHPDGNERSD